MDRSTAFDYVGSIERAAEIVTEGTAFFNPEQLAGQYAFDAAQEGDESFDDRGYDRAASFSAHLEFLREAGAEFEDAAALAVACQFAAAHDDDRE